MTDKKKHLLLLLLATLLAGPVFPQPADMGQVVEDIRTLIEAGKLAEADNLTNRYIVDDPINVDLLMLKGNIILNKYIGEQQAQMSLRPNFEENVYEMTRLEKGPHPVVVDRKVAEKTARLWKAAATLAPARSDLHLGLCQVYAIAGMKNELLDYLPVVKKKVTDVEELHVRLARFALNFKERGDFDSAMEVYKKTAALFPDQPALLSDIAGEYFYAGLPDSARLYIQRALDHPEADQTIFGNAFFLSALLGNYDTALRAVRRLPGNSHLLYEGLLKWYRNEKKWDKPLKKLLAGNADSVSATIAGILLNPAFQTDLDHYLSLTQPDPGDPVKILIHEKFRTTGQFLPAFNAAETYCFHKQYPRAIEIFSAIEKNHPDLDADDRENFLFYYAWALWQNGQKDAARKKWEQLLSSDDFYKKSAAHWFVGKYWFDRGQKEKGREYFAKMAANPSASKYATMCWNYMG